MAQALQHAQNVDLHPRGWYPVVVILGGILMVDDLAQNINQLLSLPLEGNGVKNDQRLQDGHSCEESWDFWIRQPCNYYVLDVIDKVGVLLIDIVHDQYAFSTNHSQFVLEHGPQN